MAIFSLKEIMQVVFAIIFISANFASVSGVLAHTNKRFHKDSTVVVDNYPQKIQHIDEIVRTNESQEEVQKVSDSNGSSQNDSKANLTELYIADGNEIQEIFQTEENAKNHSIETLSFPRWQFFDDFKDEVKMTLSELSFLLMLMVLCFILSLTCILRCCCFFCNRKGYTTANDTPARRNDIEDQSFMSVSSDYTQDFYYESFFKTEGNSSNDRTVLIPPA